MPTGARVSETFIEHRFELAGLPGHWWGVLSLGVLAALLYLVVWFYRRESRGGATDSPRAGRTRAAMAGLRCLVILVLAAIWVQPILATYIRRTIESYTLVLIDGSASMQIADRYADPNEASAVARFLNGPSRDNPRPRRDELQAGLLTRNGGQWLRALAERNRVELWRYGDEPERLGGVATEETRDVEPTRPHPPTGPANGERAGEPATRPQPPIRPGLYPIPEAGSPVTDLGRAVRAAVESLGSAPIAAIVVTGDGGFNVGEPVETIAEYAKSRGIPIHAVGIGDPSPMQNVRVSELIAPASAFAGDPFSLTAHVVAQGLEGRLLRVDLVEQSGPQERIIESRTAEIGTDGRVAPVVFRAQGESAGMHTYAVRVAALPNEGILEDNVRQATVRVLERKMRVLLVASGPRWDYQYVERLLERDGSVDVSCWLQSADVDAVRDGTTVIREFPRRAEDLFGYDVVVLFDPDPRDVDAQWARLAQSLVGEHGAGLLYVAGRKHTSRFMTHPECGPVVEMLPVVVDPEAEIVINQLGYFQSQGWPVLVPAEAASHAVLAQADEAAENAAVWARLGDVFWHYPVRRAKPLATVLLRHGNPRMANSHGAHVLLATQFFGAGRTGFLGFDSTWRWRRYGEACFNRFWIQLLRHLMEGKLLSGSPRGALMTDRDSYALGEPVLLTARLLNPGHLPLEATEVAVAVHLEDGSETAITLTPEAGRPGWFRGRYTAMRVGRVQFRVALPGSTDPEAVTHAVQVVQPNLEMRRPQMDRAALRALAEGSAGGRYFGIDEAEQIPSLIESRRGELVTPGTPILLWDRYRGAVMAVLVGLLGAEWALRKKEQLL